MIGLLALHTTELEENVPVIEVTSFFTDMLSVAEKMAFGFVVYGTQLSLAFV